MKAATREWIRKAESDWLLAVSLLRRRKLPVRDHICFHFPGNEATAREVKIADEDARAIRLEVREALKL